MIDDLEYRYSPVRDGFASCGSIFDSARLKRELAVIEEKISDPAVWADGARSQPLMRERKRLETLLADDAELERRPDDIEAYFELATRRRGDRAGAGARDSGAGGVFGEAGIEDDAVGRDRSAECDRDGASGRGRDGEPGLGRDADAHVSALGGARRASRPRSTRFRMATRRGSSRPRSPSRASLRSGC